MSVLSISLRHATVLRSIFRVFLQVVRGCIRDDSGRSHDVIYMLSESYFTAPHFPSVLPSFPVSMNSLALSPLTGTQSHLLHCIIFGKSKRTSSKNHTQKQLDFHIYILIYRVVHYREQKM